MNFDPHARAQRALGILDRAGDDGGRGGHPSPLLSPYRLALSRSGRSLSWPHGGHRDRCRSRRCCCSRSRSPTRAAPPPSRSAERRCGLAPGLVRRRAPGPAARRPAAGLDRRRGTGRRPHGPAPADRRPRRTADRPRAHRPAAAAAARGPLAGLAADARQPARRAADLGAEPLPLAPLGALRGRPRQPGAALRPARLLLRLRGRDVVAAGRPVAAAELVRRRGDARLRRRRPAARGGARQRLYLVRGGALSGTTLRARRSGRSARSPTRAPPAT